MKQIREIFSWIVPIILGILIATMLKTYVFTLAKVDGTSMEPNLKNNQWILVLKQKQIHRGNVIVFDAYKQDPTAIKNEDYVKRVIGLPGDTVSAKNGVIKVNNKVINQNYINKQQQEATNNVNEIGNWDNLKSLGNRMNWERQKTLKVPENEYFVLGDHRSVSNDSRYWGFVNKKTIKGVVEVLPLTSSKKHKANINTEYKKYFVK